MSLFGLDSQSAVTSGPSVTGALSEPPGHAVALCSLQSILMS